MLLTTPLAVVFTMAAPWYKYKRSTTDSLWDKFRAEVESDVKAQIEESCNIVRRTLTDRAEQAEDRTAEAEERAGRAELLLTRTLDQLNTLKRRHDILVRDHDNLVSDYDQRNEELWLKDQEVQTLTQELDEQGKELTEKESQLLQTEQRLEVSERRHGALEKLIENAASQLSKENVDNVLSTEEPPAKRAKLTHLPHPPPA